MTTAEITSTIALVAILAAISVNAYNFSKESKYIKQKARDKGYLEGYDQGFLDGVQFIESVIPSTPKKKKSLWDRGNK